MIRRTFLGAMCAAPFACAGALRASALDALKTRMRDFAAREETTGIVTLLIHDGHVVHLDAAGWADREARKPMRTDTIAQMMSMTKPVTGAGIMALAEEGRLRLNDSVQLHLPEFRAQRMIEQRDGERLTLRTPPRPITIRDLMTHTSGMLPSPPASLGGYADSVRYKTLAEAVAIYSQQPLEFEPGTRFQYSNTGIATLGRIIEVVSGQPYEQFLEQRLFGPLNMRDSFFFPPPEKFDRIAMVYLTREGKTAPYRDSLERKGWKYTMPEGGLCSTAQDMANFHGMVLDGGVFEGRRVLSKWSCEVMTATHIARIPGLSGEWGLTWDKNGSRFGHSGAFGTRGWADPRHKLAGILIVQEMGRPVDTIQQTFQNMALAAVEA